jgi:hypothetical protein
MDEKAVSTIDVETLREDCFSSSCIGQHHFGRYLHCFDFGILPPMIGVAEDIKGMNAMYGDHVPPIV